MAAAGQEAPLGPPRLAPGQAVLTRGGEQGVVVRVVRGGGGEDGGIMPSWRAERVCSGGSGEGMGEGTGEG